MRFPWLAGGILGVLIARWALAAVMALVPADVVRTPKTYVDQLVPLYAFALSLVTGIVVGLAPALLAAGSSIIRMLRASGPGVTRSARLRQGLLVSQFAMTMIPLCGAGLLVRTVVALHGVDNGVDRHDLLTMEVSLPGGDRLSALVFGAFALCALLLTALGLYGLLALRVTERTKEIGVRIALGAHVGQLVRRVVGEGLALMAAGALVGVLGAGCSSARCGRCSLA
jgi:hypothetical protein